MKSRPSPPTAGTQATINTTPSVAAASSGAPAADSPPNRQPAACVTPRVYPWLLCASTLVAAAFCFLYITKPVIIAPQTILPPIIFEKKPTIALTTNPTTVPAENLSILPKSDHLPGDHKTATPVNPPLPTSPSGAIAQAPPAKPFEETNLRIQHILNAEAPGGKVARIDIEVPVLYQSRNFRWTTAEVEEARALLLRLADYQEKSRTLRSEGNELLDSWNHLVERSIPNSELRADSPTLPINQQDTADVPRPAGFNTTESIQIQPSGK